MQLKNKFFYLCPILWALFLQHSPAYDFVSQSKPGVYGTSKNMKCPVEIIPGRSIGPIELGRNIKEIENLGMDIKSVQGSRSILVVGRYSVSLNDQDNVMLVELEIADAPNCLTYNKQKIKKLIGNRRKLILSDTKLRKSVFSYFAESFVFFIMR